MLLDYLHKKKRLDGFDRFREALKAVPAGGEAQVWVRLPIQLGDMVMALPSLFTVKRAWERYALAQGVTLRFTVMGKRCVTLFRESVPAVFAACHLDDEFPPSRSPLALSRHWGKDVPLAVINYGKSDRLKVAAWYRRVPVRAGIGDGGNTWCYHFSHPFMSYGGVGHRVFRYLPLTRWLAGPETAHEQELLGPDRFGGGSVMDLLKEQGWAGGPYVVFGVLPLPPFPERRWLPADQPWIRLAALARSAGITPVLAGGPENREELERLARQSGSLSLAGRTDLPQLMALLANAMGTLSVDTGIAHLAAATGKPTVVVFGHGSEFWDFPCGPKVISIRGNPAGAPAYPADPADTAPARYPWTDATRGISAERAWALLALLAGESAEGCGILG